MFQTLAENFASGVAAVHAGQTAIAIERFRQERGQLPQSLDELKLPNAKTVDPFTGQSVLFLMRDNGYIVYSVGVDAMDDGGQLGPATKAAVPGTLGRDIGLAIMAPG